MIAPLVLEGTWDEIAARADELRGHRLRVEVLAPEKRLERHDPGADDGDAATHRQYVPNPVIMTDEGPATFDIYRPGPGEPVKYRDGGACASS